MAAVIASSRIIGIGMRISVTKLTSAVISASDPGISRPVKLRRAAMAESVPWATSRRIKLICWIPCETPIANTRNGTRMASGSSP
ncbi:hypothetical protein D9M72_619160 [compost metagenome]